MEIRLLDIIKMEDFELLDFCEMILKKHYKKVKCDGVNYVYAVGENTNCLVAHVDTVRNYKLDMKLIYEKPIIKNKNGVLGADDRAGVYGVLKIVEQCVLNQVKLPSVIISNFEESFGMGMNFFIDAKVFKKDSVNLFISLDRHGMNEFVYYTDIPKEVKEYAVKHGFVEAKGTYSDVMDISSEYLIPGINLSIGFYHEHTDLEILRVDCMLRTMNAVYNMMKDPIDKYPMREFKSGWFSLRREIMSKLNHNVS